MTIIFTNRLEGKQLEEAEALIKYCQSVDKTYRTPYLSNMLNFDHDMPAFFLAYQGDNLIGLLTVYADSPDIELTITIHPDYRRQGYARSLFNTFRDKTKSYPIERWSFMTEKVFLDKNPELLEHWLLEVDEDSEIWLGRQRELIVDKSVSQANIRLAQHSDILDIATLQAEAFDSDIKTTEHYAREAIEDDNSLLFVLEKNDHIISSCTVDLSSDVNYLYGLAVLKDYRGQGFGSALAAHIINKLIETNQKAFQIAVDTDNIGARKLYERLGFTYQTEVLYLNPRD